MAMRASKHTISDMLRAKETPKTIEGWTILITNVEKTCLKAHFFFKIIKFGTVKNHVFFDDPFNDETSQVRVEYSHYEEAYNARQGLHGSIHNGRCLSADWAFASCPCFQRLIFSADLEEFAPVKGGGLVIREYNPERIIEGWTIVLFNIDQQALELGGLIKHFGRVKNVYINLDRRKTRTTANYYALVEYNEYESAYMAQERLNGIRYLSNNEALAADWAFPCRRCRPL